MICGVYGAAKCWLLGHGSWSIKLLGWLVPRFKPHPGLGKLLSSMVKKRIQTPKGYPRLADSPLNRDGLGCSPWHCRTHRDVVQIYHHSAWTQQKQNFVCCHFGCNQYSSGQSMIIKHTVMLMFKNNSMPFNILMVETIRLWWNWGGSYCFIHILNYHLPRCIQAKH